MNTSTGNGQRSMTITYVIYKGDEVIIVGSLKEVAQKLNIKTRSVEWLASPVHRRRVTSRGADSNSLIAVRVKEMN